MRPVSQTRRPRQKGSAILEGALITSTFLTICIGVLDLSNVLFMHQTITERVRNASRSAIVYSLSDTQIQNMVVYGQTTSTGGSGLFGMTTSNVTVTYAGQGTNDARLTISVSGVTYPLYTPMIGQTLSSIPVSATIPLELP